MNAKKSWLTRSFSIAKTPAMCRLRNGRLSSRLLLLSYPSIKARQLLDTPSRFCAPSTVALLLERLSVLGRFKRQPHVKLCAIRTRAEVDFSVMPFDDDPVADNQAESRA
jgi:hypothetical protein